MTSPLVASPGVSALKEWAVAVSALLQGQTILLLRKGGIREQGGQFSIAHSQIWLYPTYEHQKPHLLKSDYAQQVSPVPSGWHPEAIEIAGWAEITQAYEVSDAAVVEALLPFHIWNSAFVSERLKWNPRSPLSVLLLRVYGLPQPQYIPYQSEYSGCKSWIELQTKIPPESAVPVLSEADYNDRVGKITAIVTSS